MHSKVPAAVTDSASGDAPFARWAATMAMRKNQNVGEGVSDAGALAPRP
jgi:hypothetical protein